MEVHVALLEGGFAPPAGVFHPAFEAALDHLRERRDRARAGAAASAEHALLERIADRVAAVVQTLVSSPELLAAAERRVQAARDTAAAALLTAADTLDDARLHAARIAVKKWRYAEESRAAAPVRAAAAPFAELRAVQKALGSVHDHAVLRELLAKLARQAGHAGDPARAGALRSAASHVERARLALLVGLPRRLRDLAGAVRR
jgi:CHAD domain-containing protein